MKFYRSAVFPIVLIVTVLTGLSSGVPQPIRQTVTNNDIRDAILQIVNVIRATEDKLERHEYREKGLGETLKRGLISIDRRMKQWDHFKGAFTRLDERLAAVETILIQKDERERLQSMRTFEAVEDLKKNLLPQLLDEMKKDILSDLAEQIKHSQPPPQAPPKPEITKQDLENIKQNISKKVEDIKDSISKIERPQAPPKPEITKKDLEGLKQNIGKKVDDIKDSISKVEKELKNVKADKNAFSELSKKVNSTLEKLENTVDDEKNILKKYASKLEEFKDSCKADTQQLKEQLSWEANLSNSLTEQKQRLQDLLTDIQNVSQKLDSLPQNEDLEKIKNNTKDIVKNINQNTDAKANTIIESIDSRMKEISSKLNRDHEDIIKSINEVSNVTNALNSEFGTNIEEFKDGVQSIKKIDEVMVKTADNVFDTKRRLEYGVHQILGEMGQLMKTATSDIANTVAERFDIFEQSLLDDENGALTNLTQKLGNEIDQVWRQIGIMHQKMNANADVLDKLQNQTDTYVSNSTDSIENIKGKVINVTKKITELDENLNFLMGKLLLVTHEFKNIKMGLSKSLDEIKGTLNAVQDKMKDPGPGPHKIEEDAEPDPARK